MGKKSKRSKEELIAKRLARAQATAFVARPFADLPFEADLICLRELVPAATATAKLTEEYGGHEVTIASLLPAAWQAWRRDDGEILAGMQVPVSSTDASRDVARGLLAAVDAEPGTSIEATTEPGEGPRLQDILDTSHPFDVRVLENFDYWALPEAENDADVAAALQQANDSVAPTEKLASVDSTYWTEMSGRTYVRWARSEGEDRVVDAMARLQAENANDLGGIGTFLGYFRAHGIIVPVWELEFGTQVDDVEEPIAAFGKRLDEALNATEPMSTEARRVRSGIVSRQLTIH
ncbi:MAG TPA: topoisomerase II [Brevibacterium sp.]|nr:topoisomerase II [Brevibacterium sp.]